MAKYEKYDESEGVWRTVGGRRIFIKDGQSLSDAMKASGKFKSAKKKVDYDKRPQSDVDKENERNNKAVEKIEKGKKDFDPNDFEKWREEVDPNYEMDDDRARLRYEAYKDTNVRNQSAKQKEGVRTLSGDFERDNKGRIVSQDEYDEFRQAYKEGRISKEDYKNDNYDALKEKTQGQQYEDYKRAKYNYRMFDEPNNSKEQSIKSQQSGIEKASGLKVKEAFQTDLYGNGKEDRFKLDDGRWISHTTESFGSKDDTWSVNKLENGSIESQDFKSYDDMIKHLGGNNKLNAKRIAEKDIKEKGYEYYSRHGLGPGTLPKDVNTGGTGEEENGWTKFKTDRPLTEKELNKYDIQSETKNRQIKIDNNAAYKKAFEEYKKKHPNTKLNFNQFVDMSEGK